MDQSFNNKHGEKHYQQALWRLGPGDRRLPRDRPRLRRAAGRGAILFVSSILGHQPVRGFADDADSKPWVRILAESLRAELAPHGIAVEPVVRAGLNGLARRGETVPGILNKLTTFAVNRLTPRRWIPAFFRAILARGIAPERRAPRANKPTARLAA